MRLLILLAAFLPAFYSCNSEKNADEKTTAGEVITAPVEVPNDKNKKEDTLPEEALNSKALAVEGLTIDADGLSFTESAIQDMRKKIKLQLYHIENEVKYGTEQERSNAIKSMRLNMKMFEGNFCCLTHNGAHCADVDKLKELEQKFECKNFRKK